MNEEADGTEKRIETLKKKLRDALKSMLMFFATFLLIIVTEPHLTDA